MLRHSPEGWIAQRKSCDQNFCFSVNIPQKGLLQVKIFGGRKTFPQKFKFAKRILASHRTPILSKTLKRVQKECFVLQNICRKAHF